MGFLYLSVNWIGLYTKYLTERAQRKAFLETRRSLETRFKTQKENERQERLLLSGEHIWHEGVRSDSVSGITESQSPDLPVTNNQLNWIG